MNICWWSRVNFIYCWHVNDIGLTFTPPLEQIFIEMSNFADIFLSVQSSPISCFSCIPSPVSLPFPDSCHASPVSCFQSPLSLISHLLSPVSHLSYDSKQRWRWGGKLWRVNKETMTRRCVTRRQKCDAFPALQLMFNYINKFTYLLVLVLPLLQRIKGIVVRLKRIRVILMDLKPHKISIFFIN